LIWGHSSFTVNNSSYSVGGFQVPVSSGWTGQSRSKFCGSGSISRQGSTDDNDWQDWTCNTPSRGEFNPFINFYTPTYEFQWSTGDTTSTVSNVGLGNYSVTITDANGCSIVDSVSVVEPPLLSLALTVDNHISCHGSSDGVVAAAGTGGTMPYSYQWNNSDTSISITGIAAGTYSVTITDANGCTDSSSVTVTEPAVLIAATVVDSNASCNGFLDGGATAAGTGGTMPYNYLWSNSATTASIAGVAAGTYSVTITDANGCTDSASVTVIQPAVLTAATVVDSNVSCNGDFDGGATASGSGGTMPYNYTWSNGGTNASITGVSAGTYSVTITDANGCTDSSSVIITEPTALVVTSVVVRLVTVSLMEVLPHQLQVA